MTFTELLKDLIETSFSYLRAIVDSKNKFAKPLDPNQIKIFEKLEKYNLVKKDDIINGYKPTEFGKSAVKLYDQDIF